VFKVFNILLSTINSNWRQK